MPTEGFKWLSKRQPYMSDLWRAIVVQKGRANERVCSRGRCIGVGGGVKGREKKTKTKITARLYFGPISKFVMCLDAVQHQAHACTCMYNITTHVLHIPRYHRHYITGRGVLYVHLPPSP